jgi:hypothetical protein
MAILERRRMFGALAAGCAVLFGCGEKHSNDEAYRENIRAHVARVKTVLQLLRSSADDFATMSWRDVVPEVQENISDLEQAVSELEHSIESEDQDRQS